MNYKNKTDVRRKGEFGYDPDSVVRSNERPSRSSKKSDPYSVVRRGESGFGGSGRSSVYRGYTGRYSMD